MKINRRKAGRAEWQAGKGVIKTPASEERSLYRAVWRWHFIAGLLVLPFLFILATTGALYLFNAELDGLIYRAWDTVSASGKPSLPLQRLIEGVENHTGGHVMQALLPADAGRALRMTVHTNGEAETAFVDPYTGGVLGVTRFGGVMQLVRKIHSLQYFGPKASWLMEIAAGWAIILIGTGCYLWWPRGRSGGVVTIRGSPRSRTFWRDLHAVTGAFAGVIVLFLAFTGMPWSDVWGGKVQELTTAAGLNRPNPPADVVPDWALEHVMPPQAAEVHAHHEAPTGLPWALEKAPPPASAVTGGSPIDADRAAATLARAGMLKPYSLTLPQGARGAYAATYSPERIEDIRVVYVDQYSGDVLDDVGYARFGAAAKAIEWGIAVHQGQEYGGINRYVMLAGCIAIIVLTISSATMWWKRRPRGSIGVPPAPDQPRALWVVAALIAPIAILFPLVGLSLIVAYVIDRSIGFFRAKWARA